MTYGIATELANASAKNKLGTNSAKKVGKKMASASRKAVSPKGKVTVVKGKARASASAVAGAKSKSKAAGPGRGAAC